MTRETLVVSSALEKIDAKCREFLRKEDALQTEINALVNDILEQLIFVTFFVSTDFPVKKAIHAQLASLEEQKLAFTSVASGAQEYVFSEKIVNSLITALKSLLDVDKLRRHCITLYAEALETHSIENSLNLKKWIYLLIRIDEQLYAYRSIPFTGLDRYIHGKIKDMLEQNTLAVHTSPDLPKITLGVDADTDDGMYSFSPVATHRGSVGMNTNKMDFENFFALAMREIAMTVQRMVNNEKSIKFVEILFDARPPATRGRRTSVPEAVAALPECKQLVSYLKNGLLFQLYGTIGAQESMEANFCKIMDTIYRAINKCVSYGKKTLSKKGAPLKQDENISVRACIQEIENCENLLELFMLVTEYFKTASNYGRSGVGSQRLIELSDHTKIILGTQALLANLTSDEIMKALKISENFYSRDYQNGELIPANFQYGGFAAIMILGLGGGIYLTKEEHLEHYLPYVGNAVAEKTRKGNLGHTCCEMAASSMFNLSLHDLFTQHLIKIKKNDLFSNKASEAFQFYKGKLEASSGVIDKDINAFQELMGLCKELEAIPSREGIKYGILPFRSADKGKKGCVFETLYEGMCSFFEKTISLVFPTLFLVSLKDRYTKIKEGIAKVPKDQIDAFANFFASEMQDKHGSEKMCGERILRLLIDASSFNKFLDFSRYKQQDLCLPLCVILYFGEDLDKLRNDLMTRCLEEKGINSPPIKLMLLKKEFSNLDKDFTQPLNLSKYLDCQSPSSPEDVHHKVSESKDPTGMSEYLCLANATSPEDVNLAIPSNLSQYVRIKYPTSPEDVNHEYDSSLFAGIGSVREGEEAITSEKKLKQEKLPSFLKK